MDFPPECPLFEVNYTGADKIKNGALVEGMGGDFEFEGVPNPAPLGFIIVRAVDNDDIVADRDYVYACFRLVGWFGVPHSIEALKPLTRAAEEMLAVARARS